MTPDPDVGPPTGCGGCLGRRAALRTVAVGGVAGLLAVVAPVEAALAQGWRVLCARSDVPVGSGIFIEVSSGFTVVVTRPRRDLFSCFSARCTHQGCLCNNVRDRRIHCPCHGSQYFLRTGAVASGPATRALTRQRIRIRAGNVELYS